MNNMFTAETVSPGHPDKIADLISDYVLTQAKKIIELPRLLSKHS